MSEPFVHSFRVRYAECDPQDVVFNAHYLAYLDHGITELWRAACGGYRAMLERGVDIVVAEVNLRFRSPARFDDELRHEVLLGPLGTTSLPGRHRIMRESELLVEADLRHVTVDRATFLKTPVPDWLREALGPWTVPSPGDAPGAGPGETGP